MPPHLQSEVMRRGPLDSRPGDPRVSCGLSWLQNATNPHWLPTFDAGYRRSMTQHDSVELEVLRRFLGVKNYQLMVLD